MFHASYRRCRKAGKHKYVSSKHGEAGAHKQAGEFRLCYCINLPFWWKWAAVCCNLNDLPCLLILAEDCSSRSAIAEAGGNTERWCLIYEARGGKRKKKRGGTPPWCWGKQVGAAPLLLQRSAYELVCWLKPPFFPVSSRRTSQRMQQQVSSEMIS